MVKREKKAPVERAAEAKDAREQMKAMAEVAGTFKVARPAANVIRMVEAVPTIFPAFDMAVKVFGYPISKIGLVHGPSSEGKTPFIMGIIRSFIEAGHFGMLGDFEQSMTDTWGRALMGESYDAPSFSALPARVHTYEKVRDAHRDWAENIANAREAGKLPAHVSGVFGIDSIRKLTTDKIWAELQKAVKADAQDASAAEAKSVNGRRKKTGKGTSRYSKPKGIDGVGGRAGQIKAQMTSAWFDELVPLLVTTRTSMVIISRETKKETDSVFEEDFDIMGGVSLKYESHLWIRVTSSPTFVEVDDAKEFVGDRHSIQIRRSKVAERTDKVDYAYFHTSNGKKSPLGFDRARDLFHVGQELGAVELAGSYYTILGKKAQGEAKALSLVRECERELEQECRRLMSANSAT